MPVYLHECPKCHQQYNIIKPMAHSDKEETCQYCGETLERIYTMPNIIGTTRNFGRGRKFLHKGKEITTHKEWGKAGYSDPLNSPNITSDMKSEIKRKKEKITKYDSGAKKHFMMGAK